MLTICKICNCAVVEGRELCIVCEDRQLRKNGEGYPDITAYQAIKSTENDDDRFHKMLHAIFCICERSEFQVQGRIVFVDKKTGKIYK